MAAITNTWHNWMHLDIFPFTYAAHINPAFVAEHDYNQRGKVSVDNVVSQSWLSINHYTILSGLAVF